MTDKTTPLYVVCSPCRRVGKTLLSRLLAEFYGVNHRPVAAFDLADEGPQLADYLPGITTIADIGDTRGQMAFFDRLIADDVGARIIDLSHRVFKNFFTVVQDIRFFEEARHRSIEPLILFVVEQDPKSAKAYAMLRHQLSEASLLPVRNQINAVAIGRAPQNANVPPTSLDIPLLGLFVLTAFACVASRSPSLTEKRIVALGRAHFFSIPSPRTRPRVCLTAYDRISDGRFLLLSRSGEDGT